MSDAQWNSIADAQIEISRQLRDVHDKYIYFLLAAAAAGIGVGVNQTATASFGWSKGLFVLAMLSWLLSIYYGCTLLRIVGANLALNGQLLALRRNLESEKAKEEPNATAIRLFDRDMLSKTEQTSTLSKSAGVAAGRQFWLLVLLVSPSISHGTCARCGYAREEA